MRSWFLLLCSNIIKFFGLKRTKNPDLIKMTNIGSKKTDYCTEDEVRYRSIVNEIKNRPRELYEETTTQTLDQVQMILKRYYESLNCDLPVNFKLYALAGSTFFMFDGEEVRVINDVVKNSECEDDETKTIIYKSNRYFESDCCVDSNTTINSDASARNTQNGDEIEITKTKNRYDSLLIKTQKLKNTPIPSFGLISNRSDVVRHNDIDYYTVIRFRIATEIKIFDGNNENISIKIYRKKVFDPLHQDVRLYRIEEYSSGCIFKYKSQLHYATFKMIKNSKNNFFKTDTEFDSTSTKKVREYLGFYSFLLHPTNSFVLSASIDRVTSSKYTWIPILLWVLSSDTCKNLSLSESGDRSLYAYTKKLNKTYQKVVALENDQFSVINDQCLRISHAFQFLADNIIKETEVDEKKPQTTDLSTEKTNSETANPHNQHIKMHEGEKLKKNERNILRSFSKSLIMPTTSTQPYKTNYITNFLQNYAKLKKFLTKNKGRHWVLATVAKGFSFFDMHKSKPFSFKNQYERHQAIDNVLEVKDANRSCFKPNIIWFNLFIDLSGVEDCVIYNKLFLGLENSAVPSRFTLNEPELARAKLNFETLDDFMLKCEVTLNLYNEKHKWEKDLESCLNYAIKCFDKIYKSKKRSGLIKEAKIKILCQIAILYTVKNDSVNLQNLLTTALKSVNCALPNTKPSKSLQKMYKTERMCDAVVKALNSLEHYLVDTFGEFYASNILYFFHLAACLDVSTIDAGYES